LQNESPAAGVGYQGQLYAPCSDVSRGNLRLFCPSTNCRLPAKPRYADLKKRQRLNLVATHPLQLTTHQLQSGLCPSPAPPSARKTLGTQTFRPDVCIAKLFTAFSAFSVCYVLILTLPSCGCRRSSSALPVFTAGQSWKPVSAHVSYRNLGPPPFRVLLLADYSVWHCAA